MVPLKALRKAAWKARQASLFGDTRKKSTATDITDAADMAAAAVAGLDRWPSRQVADAVAKIGMAVHHGAARLQRTFDVSRRPLVASLRHLILKDQGVPRTAEAVANLCGALYKGDLYAKAVVALRVLDCPADFEHAVLVCQSCSSSRLYIPAVFDAVARTASADPELLATHDGQRNVGRLLLALAVASPAVTPPFRQLLDAVRPRQFYDARAKHLRVYCVAMQFVLRLPGGAEPEVVNLARQMARNIDKRLGRLRSQVKKREALLLVAPLLRCDVTSRSLAPILAKVDPEEASFSGTSSDRVAVLWVLSVRGGAGVSLGAREVISRLIYALARDAASLTGVDAARVLACVWRLHADAEGAFLQPMQLLMVLKNLESGAPFIEDEALRQRCVEAQDELWSLALSRYEATTGESAITKGVLLDKRPKPQ